MGDLMGRDFRLNSVFRPGLCLPRDWQ
jgi:hypothetical protein